MRSGWIGLAANGLGDSGIQKKEPVCVTDATSPGFQELRFVLP
jgi:hypothetical protein